MSNDKTSLTGPVLKEKEAPVTEPFHAPVPSTVMNVKVKKVNQIALDPSGGMAIKTREPDLASVSNGTTAQPANPLTPIETAALSPETARPAAGLGNPAVPEATQTPSPDPNSQKEATTVAPNTGPGKVVGETETK